jgi:hypothetical protein
MQNPSNFGIYFFIYNCAQNANLAPKLSEFSSYLSLNNYTQIFYDLKFLVRCMKARFQNIDFLKRGCKFRLTSIHLQLILVMCQENLHRSHV